MNNANTAAIKTTRAETVIDEAPLHFPATNAQPFFAAQAAAPTSEQDDGAAAGQVVSVEAKHLELVAQNVHPVFAPHADEVNMSAQVRVEAAVQVADEALHEPSVVHHWQVLSKIQLALSGMFAQVTDVGPVLDEHEPDEHLKSPA